MHNTITNKKAPPKQLILSCYKEILAPQKHWSCYDSVLHHLRFLCKWARIEISHEFWICMAGEADKTEPVYGGIAMYVKVLKEL